MVGDILHWDLCGHGWISKCTVCYKLQAITGALPIPWWGWARPWNTDPKEARVARPTGPRSRCHWAEPFQRGWPATSGQHSSGGLQKRSHPVPFPRMRAAARGRRAPLRRAPHPPAHRTADACCLHVRYYGDASTVSPVIDPAKKSELFSLVGLQSAIEIITQNNENSIEN